MYTKMYGLAPRNISGFLDDVFQNSWNRLSDDLSIAHAPVNIQETPTEFSLHVIAPGLKREDFKINLEQTKTNMYGEAIEKWYYTGVDVRCTLERGPITNTLDEFGVDISNTLTVHIPRALLQSYNFMPEVGDLVFDREKYYEVNSIDSQIGRAHV